MNYRTPHCWSERPSWTGYCLLRMTISSSKRRQRQRQAFAGVIYAHQLRTSIGGCIRDLELVSKAGERTDMASRTLFLPL